MMTRKQMHRSKNSNLRVSKGIRLTVWLNIFLQISVAIMSGFFPAYASENDGPGYYIQKRMLAQRIIPTKEYTLTAGESVSDVARKFNLSTELLREMNGNRVFPGGFDALKTGDTIVVPAQPLSVSSGDTITEPRPAEAKIADTALQARSYFSGDDKAGAAGDMSRGIVTNKVNGELQQWLSRFGTARVKLGIDDNFSLKNSQLDLLLPLWERQEDLIFSQSSIHETNNRNIFNQGIGARHFTDDYMYGMNSFLDYDISHHNSRMGIGAEYGRDYLKLSTNAYFRLSGWRDSPDLDDYQERPANGWDIRLNSYLPSYPQVGVLATYEKYYGNQVALFGVDNRQKDPYALTLGLNYTPIPLVTMSVQQRQGRGSVNDTQIGAELNYQMGIPLDKQLDTEDVALRRSLAGSRYDLVERNNDIILEYQKKQIIQLNLVPSIIGYGGEIKPLNLSVKASHGLDRIDWDSSEFVAQGGQIIDNGGNNYSALLPAYHVNGINDYYLSAIAYDNKGNSSSRAHTQIIVEAPVISNTQSTFTPAKSTLPADGSSTQDLQLTIKDENNQVVDVNTSEIKLAVSPQSLPSDSMKISPFTRVSAGIYKLTVTAGSIAKVITLTPSVRGITLPAAQVTLTAQPTTVDAGKSTFGAAPDHIIADGSSESTLTFTARDLNGNPVPGLTNVTFAVSGVNGTTLGPVSEAAGVYQAQLTGTVSGTATVVPQIGGSPVGSLKATVTLTAGSIDAAKSSFTAVPSSITADNTSASTLTFTARDAYGNLVPGLTNVTFSESGISGTTIGPVSEVSGVYQAELTGTTAGTATVVPKVGSAPVGSLTANVTLTNSVADPAKSDFDALPPTITADGTSASTLRFTPRDASGNKILGLTNVTFAESGVTGTIIGTVTETSGIYEAQLTGTVSGTAVVVPQIGGSAVGSLTASITLTPGSVDAGKSGFAAVPATITADGISASTLRFTARDANGNPVPGLTNVTFSVSGVSGTTVGTVTETSGVYTAQLTGTQAGTATVTPQIGSTSLSTLAQDVTLTNSAADPGKSSLTASPDSITADGVSGSILTFTARDINGNPVPGLTNVTFAVSGVSGTTVGAVTETAGVYQAKLTGTVAGTATVVPQIGGTTVGSLSVIVTLNAGNVDGTKSLFTALPTTIAADGSTEATLSFTARDAYDNPVQGLTNVTFAVSGVTGTTVGAVTETAGVYQAKLTGTVPGTATVVPQVGGATVAGLTADVTLTSTPTFSNITVNGATFSAAAGFPKTGFPGATFALNLSSGVTSDYDWSSNAPWVTVNNGQVTLNSNPGTRQEVTITATPKSGGGNPLEYKFTVDKWFFNGTPNYLRDYADSLDVCTRAGAEIPNYTDMTDRTPVTPVGAARSANGMLWNEWGDLTTYSGSGWVNSGLDYLIQWTTATDGSTNHFLVVVDRGDIGTGNAVRQYGVTCLNRL